MLTTEYLRDASTGYYFRRFRSSISTKAEVEEYVACRMENIDEYDERPREEIEERIRSGELHHIYMRPIIKALMDSCSGNYGEIYVKHKTLFYQLYEANIDCDIVISAILMLADEYIEHGKSTESGQLLVRKNENGEYEEFQPLIAKYDDDYDDNLVRMIRQVVGLNSIIE